MHNAAWLVLSDNSDGVRSVLYKAGYKPSVQSNGLIKEYIEGRIHPWELVWIAQVACAISLHWPQSELCHSWHPWQSFLYLTHFSLWVHAETWRSYSTLAVLAVAEDCCVLECIFIYGLLTAVITLKCRIHSKQIRQEVQWHRSQMCLPSTRRLTTAKRWRVSNVFVVKRVKICLTSGLINVQNLVVVSRTVCAHVGGPTNLEDAGVPSLGTWVWLTLRKHSSPVVLPHQISSLCVKPFGRT